jgi:hypothetical protein
MSKGSGGGGRPGRSGGGGSPADAGQPGEVVREANKANLDEAIRQSYKKLGMIPPGERTAAQRDEANARNLESSRQSDIAEGGKSFKNPSVYKSNAPPSYKAPSKTSEPKGSNVMPSNAKKGDTWTNPYGKKFKYTGSYWDLTLPLQSGQLV